MINLKEVNWKKELREIKLNDILIILAIILLFLFFIRVRDVYNDPCSYCVIKNSGMEPMTYKEYFNSSLKININELNLSFIKNG